MKFQVDTSNTLSVMLRIKMWGGRTEGQTDGYYFYISRRLLAGDKNLRTATGLCGVRLLHDNASSHKAIIVREYMKQEKEVELPHPPYLPDFAPCDFFLFPRLKITLLEENIANNLGSGFSSD
jgi:hypothetical protein